MQYLIISYFLLILLNTNSCVALKSAVTYEFNGGRLGDNLLAYSHAKWISYLYNIPLLFRPFEYSDQLMMHNLEEHLTQEHIAMYNRIIDISEVKSYTIEPDAGILYIIPYFPDSIIEMQNPRFFFYFPINWQEKGFKAQLKKMICPIKSLERPDIPDGFFSVALHVRVGTGFDIPTIADWSKHTGAYLCQLKCAPFSYYVQQLKFLLKMFPNKEQLYIYMFTDHDNPGELARMLGEALNNQLVIHYHKKPNWHNLNVLEDLFAMADSELFDCLIRPDSNLSIVSSKLGDHEMQISPWHSSGSVITNDYVIDQICINDTILSIQSN